MNDFSTEITGSHPDFNGTFSRESVSVENWTVLSLIERPLYAVEFTQIDSPQSEHPEAAEYREGLFTEALNRRLNSLKENNPSRDLFLDRDSENNLCLCEVLSTGNIKKIMWDGKIINIPQMQFQSEADDGSIEIRTFEMNYSTWHALLSPEYRHIQEKHNMHIGYAGLGISILVETSDGYLAFTKRPAGETLVYPGRMHVVGGSPLPGQSPIQAAIEEVEEELGLKCREDFNPQDLFALGIVLDNRHQGHPIVRPEIACCLKIKLTAEELRKKFEKFYEDPRNVQPDVEGIELIELSDFVCIGSGYTGMTKEAQAVSELLIPPAAATLALARIKKFED